MSLIGLQAFITVLIPTLLVVFLVYVGAYDRAFTEVGMSHYAERKAPFLMHILPKWIKMPLNTVVNLGYVICGAYWCAVTNNLHSDGHILSKDAYMSYVFNIMAIFYGPIQCLRVLAQKHRYAILDQWVTLPFFMWVFVWGRFIKRGWNETLMFAATTASICSYTLTLYIDIGFEILLGIHVVLALTGAWWAYQRYKVSQARRPFLLALLSCAGFVSLKLMDLPLAKIHPFFTKISGHFLSKIADVLQIHFVNQYFACLTEAKMSYVEKKVK